MARRTLEPTPQMEQIRHRRRRRRRAGRSLGREDGHAESRIPRGDEVRADLAPAVLEVVGGQKRGRRG
jgi:hypothetical protein